MAIEHLTQEQIDKIILEGAKISDVTGEKPDQKGGLPTETSRKGLKKDAQESGIAPLKIKRKEAVRRLPSSRSVIRNGSEGYHVVVIGEDKGDYKEISRKEDDLPESPLMEYALFTFNLKSGSIKESASSLFGSLVKRLLDTDYSWLASPHTQNLLVARFNGEEGLLNGVYRAVQSRYKSYGRYIYEAKLVFSGSADDEKRFASGLEHEVRSYSDYCPGAIYLQKELREYSDKVLENLGIRITAEHDLGSFPREETRKK